eukprot:c32493_g1_i1 orf=79-237(-)
MYLKQEPIFTAHIQYAQNGKKLRQHGVNLLHPYTFVLHDKVIYLYKITLNSP